MITERDINLVIDGLNETKRCADRCEELANDILACIHERDYNMGYKKAVMLAAKIATLKCEIKETINDATNLKNK